MLVDAPPGAPSALYSSWSACRSQLQALLSPRAPTVDTYKNLSPGVVPHKPKDSGELHGHLSSDLSMSFYPGCGHQHYTVSQSSMRQGTDISGADLGTAGVAHCALASQGRAHCQDSAPEDLPMATITQGGRQCDGGGEDNCALGEWGRYACVFRRSERPQIGHSERSLLQHKGIKALLALGFPFLIYLRPPYNFQRDNTKATDLVSNTNSGWS